jgi:hypothetical protein
LVRLRYAIHPTWEDPSGGIPAAQLDTYPSPLDGQAVVLLAASQWAGLEGDESLAARLDVQATRRMRFLRTQMTTDAPVFMGGARLTRGEVLDGPIRPNWQTQARPQP